MVLVETVLGFDQCAFTLLKTALNVRLFRLAELRKLMYMYVAGQ